jgi:tetratricopeptide (TPR) repeat protein
VGWQHLTPGRIDEAIAEQRRLTAADPDEPMHLLRLGQVLTEIGLLTEAERVTRRAIELAPDDDLAHALLGAILLCDPVCRGLKHGFDRPGALAALRRALELDPEDSVARINLALALEHDADGRRYRDPAALEEAIELYREMDEEELEAEGFELNLAIDLFRLGRFEEVVKVAEDADDPNLFSFAVAAEAVLEGADAAIARAAREVAGSRSERATVLSTAGYNLLVHRRYAEANALLQAAARSSSGGTGDQEMIELLRHLRRHEEVELDTEGPIGVVLDLITAHLRGDLDVEGRRGHLAGDWVRQAEAEVLARILDAVSNPFTIPTFADSGLPDELFLDVMTSTMTWTVEREEPLGTLVRVERKAALAGSEEVVFVIDGDDDPRVVGNDQTPVVYGRFAYELARAGEAERAAAFLDRALGLFGPSDQETGVLDSGQLLHRFWPADGPRTGEAALLAGAVAASGTQTDKELLATLRGAEVPPERRDALDLAVARALIGLELWEELVEPAREIARKTEDDTFLRAALSQSNRLAELADLMEADLDGEDGAATHEVRLLRAQVLSDAGRFDEALDAYSALLAEPGASANAYNNGAWLAVAHGVTDERPIAWARRSLELSERPDHARLHTLATALAARGRTLEAYDTLRAAIDANPTGEIEPADWYTLGRIAEHHGFLVAARDYYERIDPPKADDDPTTTRVMARERLHALDEDL